MTFEHIPNAAPDKMATETISLEEWNIWQALNGDFGAEAEAEAGAIIEDRIAAEREAAALAQKDKE